MVQQDPEAEHTMRSRMKRFNLQQKPNSRSSKMRVSELKALHRRKKGKKTQNGPTTCRAGCRNIWPWARRNRKRNLSAEKRSTTVNNLPHWPEMQLYLPHRQQSNPTPVTRWQHLKSPVNKDGKQVRVTDWTLGRQRPLGGKNIYVEQTREQGFLWKS